MHYETAKQTFEIRNYKNFDCGQYHDGIATIFIN